MNENSNQSRCVGDSQTADRSYPGKQALVVVPDAASRANCRKALEAFGFAVEIAETGVAAVVSTRGVVPDLVVLAGQLRDVTACEAIHWLRVQPGMRGTPIVVLNGDDLSLPDVPGILSVTQEPVTSLAIRSALAQLFK